VDASKAVLCCYTLKNLCKHLIGHTTFINHQIFDQERILLAGLWMLFSIGSVYQRLFDGPRLTKAHTDASHIDLIVVEILEQNGDRQQLMSLTNLEVLNLLPLNHVSSDNTVLFLDRISVGRSKMPELGILRIVTVHQLLSFIVELKLHLLLLV